MKILTYVLFLGIIGCTPHVGNVEHKTSPSLAGLGWHVTNAQTTTKQAQQHSEAITANNKTLRTNAQRIDDKAVVVLKWLNGK